MTSPSRTFTGDDLANAPAFGNAGDGRLWVTVLAEGAPSDPPPPVAEQLVIDKQITDISGAAVDLAGLQRGDRLVVALTLKPERLAVAPYIIEDLLPAGFEIEAVIRPDEAGATGPYRFLGELAQPDIAEARDDRFVAAIDTRGDVARRLAYIVRAVTPGSFVLPGANAEDMYRPAVFARSAPGRVQIAE
jgi:uncharacterized protein YfaS (alpha-2-macroglobulin family)